MRARHLVVFAKPPRLGRVKTRLAADIGAINAWRFYRITLNRLLRTLGWSTPWQCWLALPPERGGPYRPHLPLPVVGWQLISQGDGDLGARMGRTMHRMPPGPVVIIGSDIPGIRTDHICRAFGALNENDLVFGPAFDGGYWLVGARRCPRIPATLFADVRWSTSSALADTRRNARGLKIADLDVLEDVDEGDQFRRWADQNPTRSWSG